MPQPIDINMADVDVVMNVNPAFKEQLTIAAVARMRAENTARMEQEATADAKDKPKKAEKES